MKASISVICYKHKVLANGESPLMVRIAKDGKRTMRSLGISVNPQHWDFDKNQPKSNCPNRNQIKQIILRTEMDYQSKVLDKEIKNEEFTTLSLIDGQKEDIKAQTVEEFYLFLIKELKEDGRIGTSYAYLNSYRTLKNFNKGKKLNYTFSYIDVEFCKKFEKWMRCKGNNDVTISYQFRTLRATFNKAIEAKVVSRDKNPFIEYKLSRFNTKTAKRALSKDDILKIIDADCSQASEKRQFTQDIFTFSYLCGGISFVENNRVHKICHQINTELRAFAKELEITAEVTTYVARHSFATILKKSGVNIGIISQALGHQDIKTTQIYLSQFDNEQVDDAMKNLL